MLIVMEKSPVNPISYNIISGFPRQEQNVIQRQGLFAQFSPDRRQDILGDGISTLRIGMDAVSERQRVIENHVLHEEGVKRCALPFGDTMVPARYFCGMLRKNSSG
jgi:hypothetical protein